MAELYHLLQLFFSALLFLLSCLGTLGQWIYPWGSEEHHHKQAVVKEQKEGSIRVTGDDSVTILHVSYPVGVQDIGKKAEVIVSCDVEANGITNHCRMMQSSGEPILDRAALKYVGLSGYHPAIKNGMIAKELGHIYKVSFD